MKSRLKSVLNRLNEEKGSVFPMVLILLLLGALMIPGLLSMVSTGIVSGSMYLDKSEELYAADAGATDALWLLADNTPGEMVTLMQSDGDGDPGKYTYDLPDQVNGKTVRYEITIADASYGAYVIKSTATGPDGSSTTIEVWATPRTGKNPPLYAAASLNGSLKINALLGSPDPKEITDEDVGTGDGLTKFFNLDYRHVWNVTVTVTLDGIVQEHEYGVIETDGQIEFDKAPDNGADIMATYTCCPGWVNTYAYDLTDIYGSAEVYGDAHYYEGGSGVDDSADLYGEKIPEIFPLRIAMGPEDSGTLWEGDMDGTDIEDMGGELGNIHITGGLALSGGVVTLTGTVWVEGQIDIHGGAIITDDLDEDDTPYYIVSEYSGANAIYVNGNAPSDGSYPYKVHACLYAPSQDATITVNGDGALDGSAVAWGDVKIVGSATLRNYVPLYDRSFAMDGMDILAWKIY